MSEDSLADRGSQKTRPALGDVTNRPVKRGFSELSSDSGLKSGDGYVKNVGGKNADPDLAKELRIGLDKFLRESALSLSKDKQPRGSFLTSTGSQLGLMSFCEKTNPVVSDEANRPAKRGFPEVSSDSGLKSGDGYVKNVEGKNADSQLAKQLRIGLDKFVQEREFSLSKDKQPCGSSSTSTETDTSQENSESLVSNVHREFRKYNVLEGGIRKGVTEVGELSRESSFSSVSMATCSGAFNKDCSGLDSEGRHASCATQSNPVQGPGVTVCKDNEEGLGVDKLASTKSGSIEWLNFTKRGSISHELGRCATLKGDGCSNMGVGDDFINACSCSFCLKAAYIWSDLQFQDIKGRLAALKKSQKEANTLAQKSCREKETDSHSQGNTVKSSKLESDLTGQWKSLFFHMEDTLVRESNQLQASFLALKDLRENCKMDLEMINGIPPEKH